MATTCQTLVDRTRRLLRDWPVQQVTTTASISSSGTTLSVPDTTVFATNAPIEVETETMLITALASGTNLTVIRGAFGSTAASHATAVTVLVKPAFYSVEIIDNLNMGIQAMFPRVYQPVVDESLTATANTYEYTVPNMASPVIPIPFIYEIDTRSSGDIPFLPIRGYEIIRGATPKIRFRRATPSGDLIRIKGFGPFPALVTGTDTLSTAFPARCEFLPPLYAAASLLMSGEAGRVRADRQMTDDREQANRTGASAAAGQLLMNRFYAELAQLAMPPLPRHVKSVI